MTTVTDGSCCLMDLSRSRPPMRGMTMSLRTIVGGCNTTFCSASSPSAATSTSKPRFQLRMSCCRPTRWAGLSSAIRIDSGTRTSYVLPDQPEPREIVGDLGIAGDGFVEIELRVSQKSFFQLDQAAAVERLHVGR